LEKGSIVYCRLLEERSVVECRQCYWKLLEEESIANWKLLEKRNIVDYRQYCYTLLEEESIANCKLLEERSIMYYRQPTHCVHCRKTVREREYSVLWTTFKLLEKKSVAIWQTTLYIITQTVGGRLLCSLPDNTISTLLRISREFKLGWRPRWKPCQESMGEKDEKMGLSKHDKF